MKKTLALVLALVMVLFAVGAMAAGSKGGDDIPTGEVTPGGGGFPGGGAPAEDKLSLIILPEATEEIQKVLDAFKEAFDAGDVLAAFPDDVREKIPEELTQINEMVPAQWTGDTEKAEPLNLVKIKLDTLYEPAGEKVAVLFGKVGGEEVVWTQYEGTIQEDGSIEFEVPGDDVKEQKNEAFVLAVVSK